MRTTFTVQRNSRLRGGAEHAERAHQLDRRAALRALKRRANHSTGSLPPRRPVPARRHGSLGWRPHRAKDRAAPINARVEKVAHGPFFRAIWPHRAIIAINNWLEWVDEGGPKKQPYLIRHRDQSPILCAAIGQYPNEEHGSGEHDGFVIITADSAGGMVDVHDRRPVVLSPELAREWLDPATPKERAEQMALHQGEPSEEFEWFQVDRAVGNVRNQGPELIRPVSA